MCDLSVWSSECACTLCAHGLNYFVVCLRISIIFTRMCICIYISIYRHIYTQHACVYIYTTHHGHTYMYLWPGRAADGAAAGTSARPQALQPVHAVAWKCVTSLQHVLLHLGARMGPASTIVGQNKAKLSFRNGSKQTSVLLPNRK